MNIGVESKAWNIRFWRETWGASVGKALRFTLTVDGVSSAIVGTIKPGRWQENATQVSKGSLDKQEFETIRDRWKEVAKDDWRGQV